MMHDSIAYSPVPSQSQSRVVRIIHDLSEQGREIGLRMDNSIEKIRSDIKQALYLLKADTSTSPQLVTLAQQLLDMRTECERVARSTYVTTSLRYDALYSRHSQIVDAHNKTFEWIFDPNQLQGNDCEQPVFNEWLRTQNGIYWISGKAGSGKSTLVKWICRHPKTQESLRLWAGKKELVIASHFFWCAGTDLQKSQQGLLRSLLFDVFRSAPELIPIVAAAQWQRSQH
jgi:hypothetical protein